MTSTDSLQPPVIDAAHFSSNGWLPALDSACAQWGCFQLINHGLPQPLLDSIVSQMRHFFGLPRAEKLAVERTQSNAWGFYDHELTKNVRDWKEIFDLGPAAEQGPMAGSTPQWPAGQPRFCRVIEQAYASLEEVARQVLWGIGENLGMDAAYREENFHRHHSSFLRLNYYPVCEQDSEHLGISPHTDAGALTVLIHDSRPGLQFYHAGQWHTLQPIEGAVIINIGDIVQVWSNDRYRAPLHRVRANAAYERYSAPFFFNPDYACNYQPLGDEPPVYRTINWGEFRAGRAAGDYANLGEEVQISDYRL